MKSRQALIRQIADENDFSIRQLYQWIATARGHYTIVGSADADRRHAAGMVRERGGRRLQHPAAVAADRARRLRRPGDPRAAAPRPVPHRLRGPDAAREPRPALPGQPPRRRPRGRATPRSEPMTLQTLDAPLDSPRPGLRAARAVLAPRRAAPLSRLPGALRAAGRLLPRSGRWRARPAGSTPRCSRRSTRSSRALWNGRRRRRAARRHRDQPAALGHRLRRGGGARHPARPLHGPDPRRSSARSTRSCSSSGRPRRWRSTRCSSC